MTRHAPLPPYPRAFAYPLPQERVALAPARPRDSARLLVYHQPTAHFEHRRVRDLPILLPKGTLVVVNNTKVVPARLVLEDETGREVPLLLLPPFFNEAGEVRALAPRAARAGALLFHRPTGIRAQVERRDRKVCALRFQARVAALRDLVLRWGEAPLPPYLQASPLSFHERRRRYQTVFARIPGSVAAPTASLHFTRRLLSALRAQGHDITAVTLHVGLGTFAPLTERELKEGKLHQEWYAVGPRAVARIREALKKQRPIVAVGTTTLRTLETVAQRYGEIRPAQGVTDLFIYGKFPFRIASGLFTNFHMPQSSLLMLVDAFLGGDGLQWQRVYREALEHDFRFLSFGDASLLWRG
ncbi:tRNA preQ1(34) S-adenosylmethionine ribosyltransferase-isomerase QueA [Candidatus Parcubacteria bacterium]|nr:MAG: tRNA preQ1(34) S-adenosylmethionine ribosyltransferase-isomerase QueA [Candidatus Parcubacteria bacterium]